MASLEVKVSEKKVSGETVFEGTVSLPGLAPTKLARKSDGTTRFASRGALGTVARSVAKSLGFEAAVLSAPPAAPARKAAKKNVTTDQPAPAAPTGDV